MREYSFWFIVLIISLVNVVHWLVDCDCGKRKTICAIQTDEQIKQCEFDHFEGYIINKEIYQRWPELKWYDAKNICADYLRKFFPRSVFKFLEASIMKVNVYYKQINNDNIGQLRVNALECHNNLGKYKGREYFHFIRAPRHGCMYLVNRARASKKMHIAIELCDSDTYHLLKTNGKLRKALSSARTIYQGMYDDRELREVYERKHSKDYWLHKDVYLGWPEIELAVKGTDEYCHIFMKILHPKSELPSELKSEITYLALSYINIKPVDYEESENSIVIVAALNCTFPIRYKRQKSYQFIKAPISGNTKCVYWVNEDVKSHRYRITKELCENNIVEVKKLHNKRKQEIANDISKRMNCGVNEVFEGSTQVNSSLIKSDPDEGGLDDRTRLLKH